MALNKTEVAEAIASMMAVLDAAREAAWQALSTVEGNAYQHDHKSDEERESDSQALGRTLRSLHRNLLVTMELAGLTALIDDHRREFSRFRNLSEYRIEPELGIAVSDCLLYLDDTLENVRSLAGADESLVERMRMDLLESMLKKTAAIVQAEGRDPEDERDVRDVMHRYLAAVFPDYTRTLAISGSPKGFKPDAGVRRLGVAIEFKFVDNPDELKQALSGLYEDESGYRGSKDWPSYIAVIYQTKPFATEEELQEELRRTEVRNLTAILVVGPGKRRRRAQPRVPRARERAASDPSERVPARAASMPIRPDDEIDGE